MPLNLDKISKRNKAMMNRVFFNVKRKYNTKVKLVLGDIYIMLNTQNEDFIEVDMHLSGEIGFKITLWMGGKNYHSDDAWGVSEGSLIAMIEDMVVLYNANFYAHHRQMTDSRTDQSLAEDATKTFTWYGKPSAAERPVYFVSHQKVPVNLE